MISTGNFVVGIDGFSLDTHGTRFPFNNSKWVSASQLDFHVRDRTVYWTHAHHKVGQHLLVICFCVEYFAVAVT